MNRNEVLRLLDEIEIIRDPCDLDLLLFFVRHRRALLTSEHLSSLLGYELKRIAESLELLLSAGLLKRTANPTHAARLYVLVAGGSNDEWLPALLQVASSREGRLALIEALPQRSSEAESEDLALGERDRIALVR